MRKPPEYDPSEIGQFKLGVVVEMHNTCDLGNMNDIGHVVGFGRNCLEEVVIRIVDSMGNNRLIHPSLLRVL